MSYKLVDAVLGFTFNINPTAKLVLVVLARYANNKTGLTWPSVATIADKVGIDKRNVSTHLGTLRACGVLDVVRGGRGGRPRKGGGGSTVYRIRLDQANARNNATDRAVFDTENHDADVRVSNHRNHDADVRVSGKKTMTPNARNHDAGIAKTMMPASYESVIEPIKNREVARAHTREASDADRACDTAPPAGARTPPFKKEETRNPETTAVANGHAGPRYQPAEFRTRDPNVAALKGKEYNLTARPGETTKEFLVRINRAIEQQRV